MIYNNHACVLALPSLQKEIGCFNHQVIGYLGCRIAREAVLINSADCIKQLERKLPRLYLTTSILQLVTIEHL